jgi:hypothetical protein
MMLETMTGKHFTALCSIAAAVRILLQALQADQQTGRIPVAADKLFTPAVAGKSGSPAPGGNARPQSPSHCLRTCDEGCLTRAPLHCGESLSTPFDLPPADGCML